MASASGIVIIALDSYLVVWYLEPLRFGCMNPPDHYRHKAWPAALFPVGQTWPGFVLQVLSLVARLHEAGSREREPLPAATSEK